MRRKRNVFGISAVLYLPVGIPERDDATNRRNLRLAKFTSLHQSINFVVKLLAEYAVESLLCTTNDSRRHLLHLLMETCFADISESEDLLRVNVLREGFDAPFNVIKGKNRKQRLSVFTESEKVVGQEKNSVHGCLRDEGAASQRQAQCFLESLLI